MSTHLYSSLCSGLGCFRGAHGPQLRPPPPHVRRPGVRAAGGAAPLVNVENLGGMFDSEFETAVVKVVPPEKNVPKKTDQDGFTAKRRWYQLEPRRRQPVV